MRKTQKLILSCSLCIALLHANGSVLAEEIDSSGLSNSIERLAAAQFDDDKPGCAVGVIYRGEAIHKAGYGMANLEHGVPITSKSVFRIGSISKQFTAMAVAILAERGDLDLDADIHRYLPELMDYGHPVSIRQMIHHVAGMGDYDHSVFNKSDGSPYRFGNEDYLSNEKFLEIVARADLIHPPGSKWQYSNLAYILLAQVVEKASGKTLHDFAEEELFAKLGMKSTLFNDDVTRIIPGRVDGYLRLDDGLFKKFTTNLSWVGDGGVFTSIDDFIAWDQNFYANRLGNGDWNLVELAESPHPKAYFDKPGGHLSDDSIESSDTAGYGFGLMVDTHLGVQRISHTGGWAGFVSMYQRFPKLNLSVVSFCNVPDPAIAEFWDQLTTLSIDAAKSARPD